MTTLTAPRVLTALASGLVTTAYYATPDFLESRAARGWAKAGIAAASVVVDVPLLRAERTSRRAANAADADVPAWADRSGSADGARGGDGPLGVAGAPGADDAEPSPSAALTRRAVAVGALAVAASLAGLVAVERGILRRGEARAAAGVRFAHTRSAAVLGALTVVLSLLPSLPGDAGAGDADAGGGDAAGEHTGREEAGGEEGGGEDTSGVGVRTA